MKLEWIDDLLAIVDAGSLSKAAQQRYLTQPAFSRRIRAIETAIGATLIDRSCKPVQLKASILELEPRLREVAYSLHELKREMKNADERVKEVIIVGQHAISTAISPELVRVLTDGMDLSICVRSANREECYSLLFAGQADIGLLYQFDEEDSIEKKPFVEVKPLLSDPLIPVIASHQRAVFDQQMASGLIRVIAYPKDVFLGRVLQRTLLPQMSDRGGIHWVAETALTTAALQFALSGIGLAWVPLSLAHAALQRGELIRLDSELPVAPMTVVAVRLLQHRHAVLDAAWQTVINCDSL